MRSPLYFISVIYKYVCIPMSAASVRGCGRTEDKVEGRRQTTIYCVPLIFRRIDAIFDTIQFTHTRAKSECALQACYAFTWSGQRSVYTVRTLHVALFGHALASPIKIQLICVRFLALFLRRCLLCAARARASGAL